MYNVLIVDDEPIILSGIKFLIDWEKNDCTIMDTARNGREALDKIRSCTPDIVLCDIGMPVMDGMELLKTVNQEFPAVVFVMLTNLQEFQLAKDAVHYRAVEYLLKSQLEAPMLEDALTKAKQEFDLRNPPAQSDHVQYYEKISQMELLQNACMELLFSPDPMSAAHAAEILQEQQALDGYGILYIPFHFDTFPQDSQANAQSPATLTAWEKELADRLADSIFAKKYLHIPTGQNDCLTMFIWGQKENWKQQITLFASKFVHASVNITQIRPAVCPTPCFHGAHELETCRDAYFQRIDEFYLDEKDDLSMEPEARPSFEPLGLTGIGSQLEAELNARNLMGCTMLLDKAMDRLSNTFHQKSQAIWLCNELFRSASKALPKEYFSGEEYRQIKELRTRSQVLRWIETLKNSLADYLHRQADNKSNLVELAKQYVLEHVEEPISLQDAADHVFISPAYLSTLFKKQCHQSFIAYVNQVKIERACQLIAERKLLISQIAFQLGYNNAYYFAKVFRQYKGMSPTEWEKTNC